MEIKRYALSAAQWVRVRKAAGRRMAEAGCTAHQIMTVLGIGLKEAMI